ncbi:hypothetical protein H2198_006929 [Neophaeococcomyces mojaviensis]|uniref:Uncharacterized protein n=1 Tax=Neophaeococcomyces mojaviensis TaxID=3383035 RepID=A0ACC3A1W5_9EURO|nr:hypothetical protein H2198_006929 [Knufia sp. JES_112]
MTRPERLEDEWPVRNICCIGAGHVGGPTSTVIAFQNPDITIVVTDKDEERISAWKTAGLPVEEPGLLDLVRISRDGTDGRAPNLFFSSDIDKVICDARIVFVAVNVPTNATSLDNEALDTSSVEATVKRIARCSTSDKIIVLKSTVPCGTSRRMRALLNNLRQPGVRFEILSNPEFLAEGTAVSNLLHPDRVLIGSEQDVNGLRANRALRYLYQKWVPRERIVSVQTESAELAKLAANVFLAQRLSSINALSFLCAETGADIKEVAMACGLDKRIGSAMLRPSLGFGGSCLKKDVFALGHLSDSLELRNIGSYWRSINKINESQKSRFLQRILWRLEPLTDPRVAVLGAAFKKGTSDVRGSTAVDLIATLTVKGFNVSVYDPKVRKADLLDALTQKAVQQHEASSFLFEHCNSA